MSHYSSAEIYCQTQTNVSSSKPKQKVTQRLLMAHNACFKSDEFTQCSGRIVGVRRDQHFPRLPSIQTRCTPDCSSNQQGAGNRAIIVLKHPQSPAPTTPTKQGTLTQRDLEMARSREAAERKSQMAILIHISVISGSQQGEPAWE